MNEQNKQEYVSAHEFLLALGATFAAGVIATGTVELHGEAQEIMKKEEA